MLTGRLSDKVSGAPGYYFVMAGQFYFKEIFIMKNEKVTLVPLTSEDREQFITDNQWAFKYGALMEFGKRDDHLDSDGEIISRKTIERSIDAQNSETYRIMFEGRAVGGVVLMIDKKTHHNHLDLLFIAPEEHGKGIGYGAWQAVEALHPETEVWETFTPYFEKRNIHFYVNKCGFHAVEFFCEHHLFKSENTQENNDDPSDAFFRFEKVMK